LLGNGTNLAIAVAGDLRGHLLGSVSRQAGAAVARAAVEVAGYDAGPLAGRAISQAAAWRDIELMKGANLNAMRTSHYPPNPEALNAADELGLYVEDEAPFCWATLTDRQGAGLKIVSDGRQHVRATVGPHAISVKVLDYYGGSATGASEWDGTYGNGQVIPPGATLAGAIRLQLLPPASRER
jgi:hypothetical protein